MTKKFEEIQEERRRLKEEYGGLYESLSALLFEHDPIGINFEVNPNEYESEAGTILPRLHDCESVDDVEKVVYEEFVRWFGATAGPPAHYREIASEIWMLLQRYRY